MTLITLTEYKALMGVQAGNTRDDVQIAKLIPSASQAVETYTGRSFALTEGAATARDFLYDGSGFLDIDDATSVTSIDFLVPNSDPRTLDSQEWTAMPQGGPVIYYLLVHGGISPFASSPEMGFTWNADRYPALMYRNPTLSVTANWGWEEVPEDVKLATALTVKQYVGAGSNPEGLTAEAIEGFSRAWGGRTGSFTALAIPNRARDLLAAYQRVFV
jgi:hypothetical protein